MTKSAKISECGQYRYLLTRRWAEGTCALFVMVNPSTADGQQDDRTISRCCALAKTQGHGAIEVVNAFAYRSTDQTVLRRLMLKKGLPFIEGPDNVFEVAAAVDRADVIFCAWGVNPIVRRSQSLRTLPDKAMALRLTKGGGAEHPLYIPKTVVPVPFDVRAYLANV